MRVSIAEGKSASDPLNVGTPEVVFPWSYFNQPGGQRRYAVSESDDRFFVIGDAGADGGGPDGPQINVVLNWVEELHARVPIP